MQLDAETQDFLDQLAARGPAQPQATLGEAWSAAWAGAGLGTIGGAQAPRAQALDELRGAYRAAVGADAFDEARRQGIDIDFATDEQKAATIGLLARGLPEAAQQQLAPHLDVGAKAASIAARTERTAAETAERTWGVTANGAMVLAGLARTMVDPATLAATAAVAVATPETSGLAAFLAREAFINAGATAVTQPVVNMKRERLGLAPAPLLESLAESAVAGAALGGLFRGAGAVWRRTFGRAEAGIPVSEGAPAPDQFTAAAAPDLPPAARAAAAALEPEDFNLAARHVDNRAVEDLTAPEPDPASVIAHGKRIDATVSTIDEGGDPLSAAPRPDDLASPAAQSWEPFTQVEPRRPELLNVTGIKNVRRPGGEVGGPRTKTHRNAAPIPEWFGNVEGAINELSLSLGLKTRPKLWVGTPMREDWRTGGAAFSHGHIVINDNITAQAAINTAIHELGHQVEYQKFSALPQQEQRLIKDAWLRDTQGEGRQKTILEHRPITGARYSLRTQGQKSSPYARSFPEWFAEQVSRFITTQKEPVGIVEKFFAGIADVWRQLYARVVGHVPLSKEVDAFMRKTWRGHLSEAIGAPEALSQIARPQEGGPRPLSDYPLRAPEPPPPAAAGAPAAEAPKAPQRPAGLPPEVAASLAARRAEAERAIAEAGDAPFDFTDEATGDTRRVAPSALLRELDEDAAAARELELCLTGIDDGAPE